MGTQTTDIKPALSPPSPVYLRSTPPPPALDRVPPPPPLQSSDQTKQHASKPSLHDAPLKKPISIPALDFQDNAIMHNSPISPVIIDGGPGLPRPSTAQVEDIRRLETPYDTSESKDYSEHESHIVSQFQDSLKISNYDQSQYDNLPYHHKPTGSISDQTSNIPPRRDSLIPKTTQQVNEGIPERNGDNVSAGSSRGSIDSLPQGDQVYQPLQYHHQPFQEHLRNRVEHRGSKSTIRSSDSSSAGEHLAAQTHLAPNRAQPRPNSSYSDFALRGRTNSPQLSPYAHARTGSPHSVAPQDARPMSYIDLMNVPYPQPPPAPTTLSNSRLRSSVGNNASLLSHKQTFEMYLANVKKTNDSSSQYEFAVFMIHAAQEPNDGDDPAAGNEPSTIPKAELLREAKSILQRLADRSYPYAQYYLGDGLASGLFNKGKPDHDKAFQLFTAASKHGHVEASYRAALSYEFGWGSRQDGAKAVQYYRQAASKNHPGAMGRIGRACLAGDMGLTKRYREGLTWLKRAAESADIQYNSAPYELGILHEVGDGEDVFQDESYAAQLFTRSAELGHPEANYRLGDAYEHGKLHCPRDPALSVHFYTGAAQLGHPLAMMALCAWFMVGAEPILEKDEYEAYEWARRAAECEFAKAEYAVGYFTEMGIGCRRDPLEANVWYVRAADHGDDRARHRIAAIRAAASGADPSSATSRRRLEKKARSGSPGDKQGKGKRFGIF